MRSKYLEKVKKSRTPSSSPRNIQLPIVIPEPTTTNPEIDKIAPLFTKMSVIGQLLV
jgi:hypothetical protein